MIYKLKKYKNNFLPYAATVDADLKGTKNKLADLKGTKNKLPARCGLNRS
jgi:hypothetical protein